MRAFGIKWVLGLREEKAGNAEDMRDEAVKPLCVPLDAVEVEVAEKDEG